MKISFFFPSVKTQLVNYLNMVVDLLNIGLKTPNKDELLFVARPETDHSVVGDKDFFFIETPVMIFEKYQQAFSQNIMALLGICAIYPKAAQVTMLNGRMAFDIKDPKLMWELLSNLETMIDMGDEEPPHVDVEMKKRQEDDYIANYGH